MDDDDSFAWPADEQEAQADTNAEPEPTASSEESVDETTPSESDNVDETGDATPAESPADSLAGAETVDPVAEPSSNEQWTFPVRAAPILALQGEEVVEFPLSQHRNGTESTSLVMDDRLMRIVEARYDSDGVRRLNVRMALVKEHISGYSHTHLDLFQKLQPVWWGAIGFGLLMATGFAQSLLALGGGAFVLTGVAGLLMAQLDLIEFRFPISVDAMISTCQGGVRSRTSFTTARRFWAPLLLTSFERLNLKPSTSMRSSTLWRRLHNPLQPFLRRLRHRQQHRTYRHPLRR